MTASPTPPEDSREVPRPLLPPLSTRVVRRGAAGGPLSGPLGPFGTRSAGLGEIGEARPLAETEAVTPASHPEPEPEPPPSPDELPWLMPWQPSPTRPDLDGESLIGDEGEAAEAGLSQWEAEPSWGDEGELAILGEAAPEEEPRSEELPGYAFGGQDAAEELPPEGKAAPPAEIPPESSLGDQPAAELEEAAARLERIARTLRERGPEALLAEHPGDPLGALVTGYLIGLSQIARRRDEERGIG